MSKHKDHSHLIGRKLLFTIILNIGITIAQIIGGLISGSLSLLSDALHNFTDVIALVLSYIANRLSRKEASYNRTFGYKRAEIMAAFINSSILMITSFYLIYEAILRFISPQEVESGWVIILSSIAIVFNGISVFLLHKDSHQNMNLKSAYLHLLTDALASVAVLIGGLLMKYYSLFWVDPALTILIAIYLFISGIDLLKKSTSVLMLFTPPDIEVKKIVEEISKLENVNNIHHIHTWMLNEKEVHLEAHLDVDKDLKLSEFNLLQNEIEKILSEKFGIHHVNIQPEYKKEDSKDVIVQD